jgi:hypothetical protein
MRPVPRVVVFFCEITSRVDPAPRDIPRGITCAIYALAEITAILFERTHIFGQQPLKNKQLIIANQQIRVEDVVLEIKKTYCNRANIMEIPLKFLKLATDPLTVGPQMFVSWPCLD